MSGGPDLGSTRLLRASGLSALVTALSAAGHVAGGGHAPGATTLGAFAALAFPVAVLLTGRRVRAFAAAVLLALGQAAAHVFFSIAHCVAPGVASGEHAGHVHGTVALAGAVCHPAGPHGTLTASMLLAHAVATILTAVAVATVERALWWLVGLFAPLTWDLQVPAMSCPEPPRWAIALASVRSLHLRAQPRRRGPPAPLASRIFALVPVSLAG